MKLLAFRKDGRRAIGAVGAGQVVGLDELPVSADVGPRTLLEVVRLDPSRRVTLFELADRALREGRGAAEADVEIDAPLPGAPKMLFLARNYLEHGREVEAGAKAPERVFVFVKPSSSVISAAARIEILPTVTQLDYEIELGVVIGRPGRCIPDERAMEHVFGYLNLNDVSDRAYLSDVRARRIDWFSMKAQDGFCPMGPYLVTRDEIPDPHALRLWLAVNGEPRQEGHTGDMIFRIPQIISQISSLSTLEPGDIISTGSPAGVALATGRYLNDGDLIEAGVDGLGVMRNRVAVVPVPYERSGS